jgi:hypothetical protein
MRTSLVRVGGPGHHQLVAQGQQANQQQAAQPKDFRKASQRSDDDFH